MKIYLHLAEGFEEVEAITIVDVLRRGEADVQIVSLMETKEVQGAHNIKVTADLLFDEADYDSCDMIVLPGGMGGTTRMANHEGFLMKLHDFMMQEKWMAAICAAPIIFGELGLLNGRQALCYPGMEYNLFGATIPQEENVVVDGNYITSKGPATSMDFALKLLEIARDESMARNVALDMLHDIKKKTWEEEAEEWKEKGGSSCGCGHDHGDEHGEESCDCGGCGSDKDDHGCGGCGGCH